MFGETAYASCHISHFVLCFGRFHYDPFLTSKIFLGKKMYSCVLSCLTIVSNSLGPMDCSPLGSSFHGILQARILEWIAVPCSRGSSQPRDQTCISCSSCTAGGFFTAEPLKKPRKEDTFSLKGKVAELSPISWNLFTDLNNNSGLLFTRTLKYSRTLKEQNFWTSLVAQWLRICLPMQETKVWFLVQDCTC